MALETFLIVLANAASPEVTGRTVSLLRRLGGRVEMIASEGKTIIATLDNGFAEKIRRLPHVKLIGGVTVGKRRLPRKQIVHELAEPAPEATKPE